MPINRTPPPTSSPVAHSGSEPNLLSLKTPDYEPTFVTQRFKRKYEQGDDIANVIKEFQSMFASFEEKQEQKYISLLETVTEIKNQSLGIRATVQHISDQYDDLKQSYDRLQTDYTKKLACIQSLEERIDQLERTNRSTCIELRNIPSTKPETKDELCNIVMNLSNTISSPLNKTDIRDIYRYKTKTALEKPIVVEFTSVLTKESMLKSVKKFNNQNKECKLSTTTLQIEGPNKPVFISENLTYKSRRLYSVARSYAKENKYNFCWTSNGRIYIRQQEGSPAIRIDTESDLQKMAALI